MSCNSCTKSFSYFRKEKGCPECGFSFCSKCLIYKKFVEKLNSEAMVCSKCKQSQKTDFAPPDVYYRRLEELNMGNQDVKSSFSKLQDVEDKDKMLLESLNNLKDASNISSTSQNAVPSDKELYERLSVLKGIPNTSKKVLGRQNITITTPKSDQEQVDDMLKQYVEETNISAKYTDDFDKLINEMASRVAKLDSGLSSQKKSTADNAENLSNDDLSKILKMVGESGAVDRLQSEELPFCEICNEDANMRCLGCKYLFCRSCFKEHKNDDDGCDKYVDYQAPES